MKHIGLFEGIGGFSLAARWMGWETIAWCEINPFGQQVLKYHYPNAKGHSDIKTTDFSIYRGQCDILTGGFPCQPFSTAGKRGGKEDDRYLFPQMLRAIREIKPGIVVAENVAGLFSILEPESLTEVENKEIQLFCQDEEYPINSTIERVQRRVIATIIEEIRAEGYVLPTLKDGTPIVCCIPACAVNAPHRRDRIWFVAHSDSRRSTRLRHELGESEAPGQRRSDYEKDCDGTFTHAMCRGQQGQGWAEGQSDTKASRNWQEYRAFHDGGWPPEPPVRRSDDGLPSRLSGITFSKHQRESIKAYGNAVVPQLVFQIFKAIEQYEASL